MNFLFNQDINLIVTPAKENYIKNLAANIVKCIFFFVLCK